MRILHTSDWHLGRSFHREGMLDHQAVFVDHLIEVVERERVDLVVVAGDVYDRALPPVDAVRLADEALARLAASRAVSVVTSGNHDSAMRLGFGSRLIDAAGVHLRASIDTVGTPVELADQHGPVAVYGLPYLDPFTVGVAWQLDERSHQAALGEAMQRVRADLAQRRIAHPGTRSIVLAHAFVAGAAESESERDISVGGVARVPTSVFDGVDYAALGHLHGPHVLDQRLRYSGSPLAYSFSEAEQRKGSWLIDLGPDAVRSAEFVPAPVPRPLARLRGTLADLLTDPDLARHEGSWVEATLTDTVRPSQPMEQLRRRFPHALLISLPELASRSGWSSAQAVATRSVAEIAADFLTDLRGTAPDDVERRLLAQAADACCHDADDSAAVPARRALEPGSHLTAGAAAGPR